jgi:hypothetical protein
VLARFLQGNFRERDYLEDTGVDVRITLKWILEGWEGSSWTGLI